MKKLALHLTSLLVAGGLMVGCGEAPQNTDAGPSKLIVVTEASYKPFAYQDAEGKLVGFDVDMVWALCKQMKRECELQNKDWESLIPGLVAQKHDAVVASMSITEDRKKAVDFSEKYYHTPARFVANKTANLDFSSTLEGKNIGVQTGTIHDTFLADNYSGAQIMRYGNLDNAYIDLQNGRLDIVFADSIAIDEGFLKVDNNSDTYSFVGPEHTEVKWFGPGVGIAVRKGNTQLAKEFSDAIKAIRANGVYEQINQKYFEFDVYGD